jgi:2-dehydropantoate 2-reductase
LYKFLMIAAMTNRQMDGMLPPICIDDGFKTLYERRSTMRVAVFGAGAVGGYFGGRIAEAGMDVVFIARGMHLQAMRQTGLRVDSPEGDFILPDVRATDDPREAGAVDVILLCVKAWQVREAADKMQPMIGPETFVIPMLNGVEAPEQLSAVLGRRRVLGGLCKINSRIAGPGHILHASRRPYFAFGESDNRRSDRAERFLSVLKKVSGVDVEIPPDIHVAMWEKFASVASFGAIGAATGTPMGIMRTLPETRRLLERAVSECVALARAYDVPLSDSLKDRILADWDAVPQAATTSMQRDVQAGKPSELDAQSGSIKRLAEIKGVATPVHSFVYDILLPRELRARGKIAWGK